MQFSLQAASPETFGYILVNTGVVRLDNVAVSSLDSVMDDYFRGIVTLKRTGCHFIRVKNLKPLMCSKEFVDAISINSILRPGQIKILFSYPEVH
jgi:hypothetical protein